MQPEPAAYSEAQPMRILVASGGRARRGERAVRIVCSLLLSCVVLAVVVTTAAMGLGLVRFTVVDSGSMRPTMNPGDVVVLTSEPAAALAVHQIVAFHPPGEPNLTVIHRVRSIEHTRLGVSFRTKGDANNAEDPWRATILGDTVWREHFRIPWAGFMVVWTQQPAIRVGVLAVMLTVLVSIALGWIWRPTSR